MFKSGNPFQQLSTFMINNIENNVFNKDDNDKNNILIDSDNFGYSLFGNDNLFLIYEVDHLTLILSNIKLNDDNELKLSYHEYPFNDVEIKTSILFSIIFLMDHGINKNDVLFKDIFDTLLPMYYTELINNLKNFTKSCNYDYQLDIKLLNSLYYYIFKNNLKFVLESDKKLLLELLINCYLNMDPYILNKTMNILGFNNEFVKCIHRLAYNIEFDNNKFKEFFNLE